MSTRCQIGIYEKEPKTDEDLKNAEVLIYKHSDGYREGVLPTLLPFLDRFNKGRGLDDSEYLGAWLMHHLIATAIKDTKPEHMEYMMFHGYGICKDFHGDIEYFYAVYPSAVKVYKVSNETFYPQEILGINEGAVL